MPLTTASVATSYLVQIDEEQRLALLALVQANPQVLGDNLPLQYWESMLAELPQVEAESPGIVHGFCL